MKRKIVIALLTLGTVGGFASGIASMSCRSKHRREAFEKHVADVCVKAARDADQANGDIQEEPQRKHRKKHRHHDDD